MITVVSGFGRCGSSLMMRMLEVGGYPAFYEHPISYETELVLRLPEETTWLQGCEGKAVKVNDPHRFRLPATFTYQVIWLDRDSHEQARSQAKFLRMLARVAVNEDSIKRLAKSIRQDRPKAMRGWKVLGASVLEIRFEDVLTTPRIQAQRVADFLRWDLNINAMAACVKHRPVTCLPFLLEAQLDAEYDQARQ
jgi:hypothetical protein